MKNNPVNLHNWSSGKYNTKEIEAEISYHNSKAFKIDGPTEHHDFP